MPKTRASAVLSCFLVCLGCGAAAFAQAAQPRPRSVTAPRAATFPPTNLCYAFLGGWGFSTRGKTYDAIPAQVWVSCGGYLGPVTQTTRLLGFAVSSSRQALAIQHEEDKQGLGRIDVSSLRPPFSRIPWRGPEYINLYALRPTCGTITAFGEAGTVDGLSGQTLSKNENPSGWAEAVCDRGREITARIVKRPFSSAYAIRVNGLDVGEHPTALFALSPNGRYFAWVKSAPGDQGNGRACVYRLGHVFPNNRSQPIWSCTPYCEVGWHFGGGAWLDSVAGDGAVVFGGASYANACPWCSSIYYWRPTDPPRLPLLLQRSGDKPQWITPAAARGLIARYRYLLAHRHEKLKR